MISADYIFLITSRKARDYEQLLELFTLRAQYANLYEFMLSLSWLTTDYVVRNKRAQRFNEKSLAIFLSIQQQSEA